MAISVKIKGVNALFENLDNEITELVNTAQRASSFQAVSDLQMNTPVDTGRAKNSWYLSKTKSFRDGQGGFGLLGPIPKTQIETLYITNGTPYVQDLNAGSSSQAPPRFVEKALSKYFDIKGNNIKVINL